MEKRHEPNPFYQNIRIFKKINQALEFIYPWNPFIYIHRDMDSIYELHEKLTHVVPNV